MCTFVFLLNTTTDRCGDDDDDDDELTSFFMCGNKNNPTSGMCGCFHPC